MKIQQVLFAALVVVLFLPETEGWRRRRRRRSPPPCSPRHCSVSSWTAFSPCNHRCGSAGTQTRTRTKTVAEQCGGRCPYHFSESRPCNRNACRNGGIPTIARCQCRAGYTGTCCEKDVNECLTRPCQHTCTNTHGSFVCSCRSCYTKLGTRCDLRQCKIGGRCVTYGTKNPANVCQDCNSTNKLSWTNNSASSCSDGNPCTTGDRCLNGRCTGAPILCLPCGRCQGGTCRPKPGFCSILMKGRKTCFSRHALRPGHQCQQCDPNNPSNWTINDNLHCDDHNLTTRLDRCRAGSCVGTPYKCLRPCEWHNGSGCRRTEGMCIIRHQGKRTCFRKKQLNPGNPCQWCDTSQYLFTWSSRTKGVPCDDGNNCTRNDTCVYGRCIGTPITCTPHCKYCDGETCSLQTNWIIVHGMCVDVLFCKRKGTPFGYHVDPKSCSRFYQCAWGKAYLKQCPPGTRWNPNNNICDHKRNVPCPRLTAAPTRPGHTGSPTVQSVKQFCVGKNGQFRHPRDCGKFVNCGSGGIAYVQSCPAGLLYNPANGQCDWAKNVKC